MAKIDINLETGTVAVVKLKSEMSSIYSMLSAGTDILILRVTNRWDDKLSAEHIHRVITVRGNVYSVRHQSTVTIRALKNHIRWVYGYLKSETFDDITELITKAKNQISEFDRKYHSKYYNYLIGLPSDIKGTKKQQEALNEFNERVKPDHDRKRNKMVQMLTTSVNSRIASDIPNISI